MGLVDMGMSSTLLWISILFVGITFLGQVVIHELTHAELFEEQGCAVSFELADWTVQTVPTDCSRESLPLNGHQMLHILGAVFFFPSVILTAIWLTMMSKG